MLKYFRRLLKTLEAIEKHLEAIEKHLASLDACTRRRSSYDDKKYLMVKIKQEE